MKKKLYFDFQFTASNRARYCPCTWVPTAPIQGTVFERYGELLTALPALTGGASVATKERQEVSAWFQLATALTSPADQFCMDFVGQDFSTEIAWLAPGGAPVPAKAGLSPVHTKHFAVRLRLLPLQNSGIRFVATDHVMTVSLVPFAKRAVDIRGVVYVQRQHSVEV
jgi:hypothetical protein